MFFCHPFHFGSLSQFVSTKRHFSHLQRRSKPYIIPVSKLLLFQLHLNLCCYPQRLPSTHFILCMNNRYMINDLNTLLNTISHKPQYWFSPKTIGCNLMPGKKSLLCKLCLLVFTLSGIKQTTGLYEVHIFFHKNLRIEARTESFS